MDIVFTIASRNYAAQARVLMRSLRQADPAVTPIVVATDGTAGFGLGADVELLDVWSVPGVSGAMALYYDALEFNTSVKPFCFTALLARPGVRSVTYLDPDILVLRPLDEVREALVDASIALTPHLTRPLGRDGAPNDGIILRAGAYNLGFLGVGPQPDARRLMEWWAERCRFDCRVDPAQDLFTDQRWMVLAPSLVEHPAILRNPGLNLAYWNLPHRRLEHSGDDWTVEGRPLVFFHFSGFDPHRPDLLSRHQDRVSPTEQPALAELLTTYAKRLLGQGYDDASALSYAHDVFGDDRRVLPALRRRALAAARQGEALERPALQDSGWFDRADATLSRSGLPDLTRAVGAVCSKARLAIGTAEDRTAALKELRTRGGLGLDGVSLEAQALLDAAFRAGDRAPVHAPAGADVWRGPAAEVDTWLCAENEVLGAPRAVAALWRARRDLRTRFRLDDPALLEWCLGPEAEDRRFAPALLPPALPADLDVTPGSLGGRAAAFTLGPQDRAPLQELRILYGVAERAGWPRRGPWFERRCVLDRADPSRSRPFAFPRLLTTVWASRTCSAASTSAPSAGGCASCGGSSGRALRSTAWSGAPCRPPFSVTLWPGWPGVWRQDGRLPAAPCANCGCASMPKRRAAPRRAQRLFSPRGRSAFLKATTHPTRQSLWFSRLRLGSCPLTSSR